MNAHAKLRALVDQLNKHKATLPSTGGDRRMQSEVNNTAAIAKGMAMDRFKVGKVGKTLPLAQLVRNK